MSENKQRSCSNCGHSKFGKDLYSVAGDVSCLRCGTVQEEGSFVNEIQFQESSIGSALVQGTIVRSDQSRASSGGRQNTLESREQTLINGRKRIRKISLALKIPSYIAEAAGEWFRLALTNKFVQGRRSQVVLAVCLYVACRKEKTHHMLIDFSSWLQISVYVLGSTFLKMAKVLHITSLPLADPSLFIQHFAEKLDFKEKHNKVVNDAVKLVQTMANDWIYEGRRPAGIAGACILLAARMNNFQRTHTEIVSVAHVAEQTLQRRLNEFKKTKSGNLSVKSFRESKSVDHSNPPSFNKNRELESNILKDFNSKNDTLLRIEELVKHKGMTEIEQNTTFEDFDLNTKKEKKKSSLKSNEQYQKEKLLRKIIADCDLSEQKIIEEISKIVNRKKAIMKNSIYLTPAEIQNVNDLKKRIDLDKPRNLLKNYPKTKDLLDKISSNPELTDLDDDDIVAESELTKDEIEIKKRIWTGLNQDFIIDQEKKKLKQQSDILVGNASGKISKKKRKINSSIDYDILGLNRTLKDIDEDDILDMNLTAADSAKTILSKKSFSNKINYNTLNDLFLDTSKVFNL